MTLGQDVKTIVDGLLSDANIRTTLTHTARSYLSSSDGGYSGTSQSSATSTSIYAVPARYFKSRMGLLKFGDLKQGDFRFITSSDNSCSSADLITFDSSNFEVRDVQNIVFNEIKVAQAITVSKVT